MKDSKVRFGDADSYSKMLFHLIHPEGLPCHRCKEPNGLHIFRRHPNSWIIDYRCSHCWRIFNPWKGTPLDSPSTFGPGVSKPPFVFFGGPKGFEIGRLGGVERTRSKSAMASKS